MIFQNKFVWGDSPHRGSSSTIPPSTFRENPVFYNTPVPMEVLKWLHDRRYALPLIVDMPHLEENMYITGFLISSSDTPTGTFYENTCNIKHNTTHTQHNTQAAHTHTHMHTRHTTHATHNTHTTYDATNITHAMHTTHAMHQHI